jgi:hypothetical protein
MPDALLLLTAVAATLAGLAWLALAMQPHWAQVHGAAPQAAATRLRLAGGLALALSFGLCLRVDHPSMAVLVWFMLLAGAAVSVAMMLSTRPQWLRWLWPV